MCPHLRVVGMGWDPVSVWMDPMTISHTAPGISCQLSKGLYVYICVLKMATLIGCMSKYIITI